LTIVNYDGWVVQYSTEFEK